MTFLEFVIGEVLGPPDRSNGNQSFWECPFCGGNFASLPHKPPHKDRWKCQTCQKFGDVLDALLHLAGIANYSERLTRLEELRARWEAGLSISPSGHRGVPSGHRGVPRQPDHDPDYISRVAGCLDDWLETMGLNRLDFALELAAHAESHGVQAQDVVMAIYKLLPHLECDDPDCTAQVCAERRARRAKQRRDQVRAIKKKVVKKKTVKKKGKRTKGQPR